MMKTLLIAATGMVLAAPVLAQQSPAPATPAAQPAQPAQPATPAQPAKPTDADFTKADADKSGTLTIAEVKLADATVTQADFDRYDADKSKSLSKVEFEKWHMAKKGDKASAPGQ